MLVVLHHVSLVYSGLVPFYYVEPPFTDPLAFKVLGSFALINQAWFMGAMFFIAGYFTPEAFDRRGAGGFLRNRLIRLGLPTLAFIFLLDPICRLAVFLMPGALTGITGPPTWSLYPQLLGLGPLWFAALLLIFDGLYAVWRHFAGPVRLTGKSAFPGLPALAAFTIALALAGYLIRIAIPLGEETRLILPFLNFPSVAYLPQYFSFFLLGIVACRRSWAQNLSTGMAALACAIAVLTSVLAFPLAISGRMFSVDLAASAAFTGNGTWQSALYALWDSTLAVGLGLAALVVFRRWANRRTGVSAFLSTHSYVAYVIHLPVVLYVAYGLRGLTLPVPAKFGVASLLALTATFILAWLLRRVPEVRKVL